MIRERRNRAGRAYALTVFAPVIDGRDYDLEAYLEALPVGAESPLARLGTLHESRVQVLRQPVYQGAPQRRDSFTGAWLIFTAGFDGALEPFLDALAAHVPEADEWWGRCRDYPGRADRAAFAGFIRRHQVQSSLFESGFPDATVADVLAALDARERLVAFAASAQGLNAASLHARFRAELGR